MMNVEGVNKRTSETRMPVGHAFFVCDQVVIDYVRRIMSLNAVRAVNCFPRTLRKGLFELINDALKGGELK